MAPRLVRRAGCALAAVAAAGCCVAAAALAGPYLALHVNAWLWSVFAAAGAGAIP